MKRIICNVSVFIAVMSFIALSLIGLGAGVWALAITWEDGNKFIVVVGALFLVLVSSFAVFALTADD